MKNKHKNGYKICYRETDAKHYIQCFKTYTYGQAVNVIKMYELYPPTKLYDGFKLNNPKWKIIAISRREVKSGIWREVPF